MHVQQHNLFTPKANLRSQIYSSLSTTLIEIGHGRPLPVEPGRYWLYEEIEELERALECGTIKEICFEMIDVFYVWTRSAGAVKDMVAMPIECLIHELFKLHFTMTELSEIAKRKWTAAYEERHSVKLTNLETARFRKLHRARLVHILLLAKDLLRDTQSHAILSGSCTTYRRMENFDLRLFAHYHTLRKSENNYLDVELDK